MKGLVSLTELSRDHEPKALVRRLRADVATRQSVQITVAVMSRGLRYRISDQYDETLRNIAWLMP